MHQLLLMLPVPPLVVDVVDWRRSWRQVCFVVVVVVVVVVIVLILIVGVLVADQCRGDADTSSSTETHSGTALETKMETDRVDETSSSPPLSSQSSNLCCALIRSLLRAAELILAFSNTSVNMQSIHMDPTLWECIYLGRFSEHLVQTYKL